MSTLKIPVTKEDHIWGSDEAFITLVEYGDYQCSYCRMVYPIIKQLKNHFGDQIRLVFRHFPLTEIHPYAELAAQLAEYAASHGKFWEMHHLLYENQNELNRSFLFQLIQILNLPPIEREQILEKKIYLSKIREQFLGGVRSGVNGVPTFFINDHRYNGTFELNALLSTLETILVK